MLNSLEQQLERIEAALASNAEMLGELLKRKRAPAQKRQTAAQKHDDAIKMLHGARTSEWRIAWFAFCKSRRDAQKYLTDNAIVALLKKLDAFPVAEQVRALEDSVAHGWSGVFPKAQEGGAVMGGDWFVTPNMASKEGTDG